jgi:hypothetical protein
MKKVILVIILISVLYTITFAQEGNLPNTIYVSAAGSDNGLGNNEAEPLRTLSTALLQAFMLGSVTRIVIIGTLDDKSEERNNSNFVFTIDDWVNRILSESSNREIIITGKQNASSAERAVLSARGTDKSVVNIVGVNIRFENITISGGAGNNGFGLYLRDGAQVTLGQGAVVQGNSGIGIGLAKHDSSVTCIINGGEIQNNAHGVYIDTGNILILRNGFIRNNRSTYGVGVYVNTGGTFTQEGGTISGNNARQGGGVFVAGRFNQNGGTISRNTATEIGGGVVVNKDGIFNQRGTVSGNTAPRGADIFRAQ